MFAVNTAYDGLLAGTGAQQAPNGAVLIGADLATSVPNIYAVGDCAACRDGSLRTSSLKVANLEIARTGLTETEARKVGLRVKSAMATGTDRPGICPNPHRITIKLVYPNKAAALPLQGKAAALCCNGGIKILPCIL